MIAPTTFPYPKVVFFAKHYSSYRLIDLMMPPWQTDNCHFVSLVDLLTPLVGILMRFQSYLLLYFTDQPHLSLPLAVTQDHQLVAARVPQASLVVIRVEGVPPAQLLRLVQQEIKLLQKRRIRLTH